MTRTVLIALGTRPEVVKLAPVIHDLRAQPWCRVRILVTGQHRELLDQLMGFFELTPDVDLALMRPDQSLADLTSRMVDALDGVLAEERPDLVLAQGDTTTVMVTALCSFYRKIPFGHVEAGLRTGLPYNPFPEEKNREITDRLSDLHFAPTERAKDNLLREGIAADRVTVCGNTVIDALLWAVQRVDAEAFRPTAGQRLLLVTVHRRESFGAPLREVCLGLRGLAARGDVEILYPVHPNPNVKHTVEDELAGVANVRLVAPLDYPDFVAAMKACDLVLTDSGGVQEEAPTLGKPVLVLRDETERPEGVAAGASLLVGPHRETIVAKASELLDDAAAYESVAKVRNPYGDGEAAPRITRAIAAFFGA